MKYRHVLVLLTSFFLMSCKAATLSQNQSFSPEAPKGLVVLSLTQEEPLLYTKASIIHGAINTPTFKSYESFDAEFVDTSLLQNAPITSDFDGEFGKLVVAELEPNTYKITRLRYYINALQKDLIYRDNVPTFEVNAGEITYLGEYKVKGISKTAMPAIKIIKEDSKKRDFEVLRKKYPNVKGY